MIANVSIDFALTMAVSAYVWIVFFIRACSRHFFANAEPLCYSADAGHAVDLGDEPCYVTTDDQNTSCCGTSGYCMSNGLCYSNSTSNGLRSGYYRGSCTDQTWQSSGCVASACLAEGDGLMIPCASDNFASWCCFTTYNDGSCNCETGAGVLHLGIAGLVIRGTSTTPTATLTNTHSAKSVSVTSTRSSLASSALSTPSTTPSASSVPTQAGKHLSVRAIAGITIGVILGVTSAIIVVIFVRKRYRYKRRPDNSNSKDSNQDREQGEELPDLIPVYGRGIGINNLASNADAIVDIVFIHGLTGKRESTWTHPNGTCWPKDLLPFDVPEANVIAFGYDADVANALSIASSNRLRDHGKSLAQAIANTRTQKGDLQRPIIFVAHSLGGLVVEEALLICRDSSDVHLNNVLKSTFAIAFLGTPHGGSGLAAWGSVLTRMSSVVFETNRDIVMTLQTDSQTLSSVEENFQQMARKQKIAIFSFYEAYAMPVLGVVVPSESAILKQYESVSIAADHVGMTKFSDKNDPGYFTVTRRLQNWVKEISTSLPPYGKIQ